MPGTPDEFAARLEQVSVLAGEKTILGPLSLRIRRGERWAVLGPNGAGKSTLLAILGAERHPSSGHAVVLGHRLGATDLRSLRRRIGTVGQRVAERLPLEAVAREVVCTGRDAVYAPYWTRLDEQDLARAEELLTRLGCGELARRPLRECSQGERQRVLIARSLYGAHELLLLDEAAGGLDLPAREALVGALEALAATPVTTVQVVHTLEELPGTTSHALLLRDGSPVACGPIEDALTEATLRDCYDLEVVLEVSAGRFHARAAAPRAFLTS